MPCLRTPSTSSNPNALEPHHASSLKDADLLRGHRGHRGLRPRRQDHVGPVVLAVADDLELDLLSDVVGEDLADELATVVHGATRHARDDVARLHAGLRRGAPVRDRVHERARARVDLHRGRELGAEILVADADPRALELTGAEKAYIIRKKEPAAWVVGLLVSGRFALVQVGVESASEDQAKALAGTIATRMK